MIRIFGVHQIYTNVTDYYRCIDNGRAEIYNKKRGWWDTTDLPNPTVLISRASDYPESIILTELTPDEFEATLIMEELTA